MTLRAYRPGDADAMYALDILCFAPVFRFSRRAMRRFAEAPGALTVLAESDTELAGFAIVQIQQDTGYVVTLDVAPAWRRLRLASQLMAEMERQVTAAGGKAISLHVFVGNDAAIRFYERSGYARAGLEEGFYGPGFDALIYGKRL